MSFTNDQDLYHALVFAESATEAKRSISITDRSVRSFILDGDRVGFSLFHVMGYFGVEADIPDFERYEVFDHFINHFDITRVDLVPVQRKVGPVAHRYARMGILEYMLDGEDVGFRTELLCNFDSSLIRSSHGGITRDFEEYLISKISPYTGTPENPDAAVYSDVNAYSDGADAYRFSVFLIELNAHLVNEYASDSRTMLHRAEFAEFVANCAMWHDNHARVIIKELDADYTHLKELMHEADEYDRAVGKHYTKSRELIKSVRAWSDSASHSTIAAEAVATELQAYCSVGHLEELMFEIFDISAKIERYVADRVEEARLAAKERFFQVLCDATTSPDVPVPLEDLEVICARDAWKRILPFQWMTEEDYQRISELADETY